MMHWFGVRSLFLHWETVKSEKFISIKYFAQTSVETDLPEQENKIPSA